MGNAWRAALGVGLVAVAVVVFLLLRPGDDEATPAADTTAPPATTGGETTTGETTTAEEEGPTRLRVDVPADGPTEIARLEAEQGDQVVLVVQLGYHDDVHIHGYDLLLHTGPGLRSARFGFRADMPGRFEIETESNDQQIAELRVRP